VRADTRILALMLIAARATRFRLALKRTRMAAVKLMAGSLQSGFHGL
jgi:hypothetical protein